MSRAFLPKTNPSLNPNMDVSEPYTEAELDHVQGRWGLRFPPDLTSLLLKHRHLIPGQRSNFDWIHSRPKVIESCLDWPLRGLWFDVQRNNLWWPEWGPKPADEAKQYQLLKEIIEAAPMLIPLFGHRYLPEEPYETGNPVFSVYQADTIHYGTDLADWQVQEANVNVFADPKPHKEIRFWSELVRRNI